MSSTTCLLEYYGYDLDQHCIELEPEENKNIFKNRWRPNIGLSFED